MAITVDAATVARWTGSPAVSAAITSASFTPPDGSLLVVCVNADDPNDAFNFTITVSGGSLTWTERVVREASEASTGGGYAGIFTAPVVTGASMTISVNHGADGGGANRYSAKAYIVTGQHASPIGASNEGSSGTNSITGSITATGDGRVFGVGVEWNALGAPTSTDTEDAAHYAGAISVMSAYKAADHAAGSGSQGINFDASGAGGADWGWCVLEILAAAAGGGAITGTGAATFTATGTLTGAGALVGAGAFAFTPAASLSGAGRLIGAAALAFTPSASLLGTGALAGVSALAFAPAAVLTGSGRLIGVGAWTFAPTGALTGAGALAGLSALTFTPAGSLGSGAFSGSALLSFAPSGVFSGAGALLGAATLSFSATAGITGFIPGVAALSFTPSGALTAADPFTGSASLTLTVNGALVNVGVATGLPLGFSARFDQSRFTAMAEANDFTASVDRSVFETLH